MAAFTGTKLPRARTTLPPLGGAWTVAPWAPVAYNGLKLQRTLVRIWDGAHWILAPRSTFTRLGAGTPTSAVGLVVNADALPGDFYINTLTRIAYQQSGFTGARGSGAYIYAAAGTPTSGAGIAATAGAQGGDVYLDTSTGTFYQLAGGTRGLGTWWYFAAGTPTSTAGIAATTDAAVGDIFVNTLTGDLYQLS
jgi:hypothetical protein